MSISITGLSTMFDAKSIAQTLDTSTPVEQVIRDLVYSDSATHPFSYISKKEINKVISALPMVIGGSDAEPVGGQTSNIEKISPEVLAGTMEFSADEVLNIMELEGSSLAQWKAGVIKDARDMVSKTVESMCAKSLTGTLTWKARTATGQWGDVALYSETVPNYAIADWANPLTKLGTVQKNLNTMYGGMKKAGAAGKEIEVLCVPTFFWGVYDKINSKMKSDVVSAVYNSDDETIKMGRFLLRNEQATYTDADDQATTDAVSGTTVLLINKKAGHKLRFLKIANFLNDMKAMPFFMTTNVPANGRAMTIEVSSKPIALFAALKSAKGTYTE